MATRSAIGYVLRGKVRATYCHYDGYPSHQLPILCENYKSSAAVAALIKPGSISCLHTNLGWDRETRENTGPLYYVERGEAEAVNDTKTLQPLDFIEHFVSCGCEYGYIYESGYGWHVLDFRILDQPKDGADNVADNGVNVFNVFHRTWWQFNSKWPDSREPMIGKSKPIASVSSEPLARLLCQVWNITNKPGLYSDRAEYSANSNY